MNLYINNCTLNLLHNIFLNKHLKLTDFSIGTFQENIDFLYFVQRNPEADIIQYELVTTTDVIDGVSSILVTLPDGESINLVIGVDLTACYRNGKLPCVFFFMLFNTQF